MPKAGIHGTRSTNWKSAEAVSKPAQIASVTANTASETARASQRSRPSRRPPGLPTTTSTMAPASGNAHESVRSGKAIGWSLSPEVVAEHQDDAAEQRAGVGSHGP